ncbi:hypothetical protein G5I_13490 [Acromyrmex echinatior]|uniref:Uncharacterized protein n=1 Tax=Acromyrmex echinatior TaxID=103372 RepID=F4X565_ACREC|nr:hypothetical protein G5I_13490 [Acromyrmex echinatior]
MAECLTLCSLHPLTAPTAPLPPPPPRPRVSEIRECRRTLPVTVDRHRKRPRAAPAGLRAHSARFPISTHTPECKGLTLPLAHSLTRIHATLRLTSFLTGPETTNFKTGISERDNKRRTRNSCQVRSYCSNYDIASNTLLQDILIFDFMEKYYVIRFSFSYSIFYRLELRAQELKQLLYIITENNFRPEDHQRHEMTGFQRVMQLSRHCATLQRCNQQGTDRRVLHIEQHSCSLALSRRDLAQPRTRMTVTVSLREAPDVVILATHRWPPGTCGPEPTDRHTTAAKIVRHLKRFSDMGRMRDTIYVSKSP